MANQADLKAKNLKPDVILMDLVMDRLDGIGATQKILAEMPEQEDFDFDELFR